MARWESGLFLHQVHHRIKRVGDNDDKGSWGVLLDSSGNLLDDICVRLNQIVAAHAWLTWKTRCHHTHIRSGDISDIVGSGYLKIETEHRSEVREVESLALRHPLNHIEQHHVAEVSLSAQKREGTTYLSSAYKRYLSSSN